jgi:uncharacterized protein (DUF58 family)
MLTRALYSIYRVGHTIQSWRRRRFTPAGTLALAGLGASAAVGVDTNLTLAYQVFTFLGCLLALAFVGTRRFRPALRVTRTLPRLGTAEQPLRYRVRVENIGPAPLRGLTVQEEIPDAHPSLEEFAASREPGEERRNPVDRAFGYFRWRWLLRRNAAHVRGEHPIPVLPPGGETDLFRELVPARRGYLRLTGSAVTRPDPLGLMTALARSPAPGSILILPKRYPLPAIPLPGARAYQFGRVALASSVGDSEEFVSLRDYRPGDPLRKIHWKSWARTGRPIVKEFQEEFFVRHALILDTFLDPAHGEVFEEAVSVAASFACAVDTQESLLDLLFVGTEAYCTTAGRGVGQIDQLLEVLACVRPCTTQPFQALHDLVIRRANAVSGCICVLLAWDDERRRFVRHLRARGVPTLALVLAQPSRPGRTAPEPAPPGDERHCRLEVGRIEEGLARL